MKILALSILLISTLAQAKVPELKNPINDYANVISESQESSLNSKIRDYRIQNGPQISVLLVDTIGDTSIEEYSMKVAEAWKLGSKEKDDGLLILFAIKDRKMRIEVGQGLEGAVTDLFSKRVLGSLKPFLRKGDYDGAVSSAVEQILSKITEDARTEKAATIPKKSSTQEISTTTSKPTVVFLEVLGLIVLFLTLIYAGVTVSHSAFYSKTKSEASTASKNIVLNSSELSKSKEVNSNLDKEVKDLNKNPKIKLVATYDNLQEKIDRKNSEIKQYTSRIAELKERIAELKEGK